MQTLEQNGVYWTGLLGLLFHQMCAGLWPACDWSLEIAFVCNVNMCVCAHPESIPGM